MSVTDILPLTSNDMMARWNAAAPLGTPVFVTYSFGENRAAYDGDARPGFAQWTEEQKSYVRQALQIWDAASGIHFLEVPDAALGQIRFGMYNMDGLAYAPGNQVSGFAYYPSYSYGGVSPIIYDVVYDNIGGDLFINSKLYASSASSLAPGQQGFSTVLHEIGHALGFKHPFEGDPVINPAFDSGAYTVMSYNRLPSTATLGSLDIEASQYYYGVRDAAYSWDPSALALTIYGSSGADYRIGTELRDIIRGLDGDDVLDGGPGDDVLDGGAGVDTVLYHGVRAGAVVDLTAANAVRISGAFGNDVLDNIERVSFSDGVLVYNIPFDADAALVYRIYQASFARTPDEGGFRFWYDAHEQQDISFYDMADFFRTSPEFVQKYGANVSNNDYVYSLYGNVLQRAPDTPGLLFWQDVLNGGVYDRNELMLAFAGSAENVRLTAPNIDDGYWLT